METSIDPQLREHVQLPPPQAPHHPWPPQSDGQIYYGHRTGPHAPNFPQSDHSSYPDTQGQPADHPTPESKRPRACEACRGLKVRCEPDPAKGTCRRCAKAGRQCVVTAPSRKRQKKTDSRVAELERKIDALTASLHATKAQAASDSDDESNEDRKSLPNLPAQPHPPTNYVSQEDRRTAETAHIIQQRASESYVAQAELSPQKLGLANEKKRRMSHYPEEDLDRSVPGAPTKLLHVESPELRSNRKNSGATSTRPGLHNGTTNSLPSTTPHSISPTHEYADVIDRKILTAPMATEIFEHYTQKLASHLPLVVFPSDTPAGSIRKYSPTLFLAILSVASGQEHPDLQRILAKEVMRTFADRIVYRGEKSLELIQALQVLTVWYWPEENRDAQTYQLIHMAAIMAIDLGIGRRSKGGREPYHALWKDYHRPKASAQPSDSLESRRAWLGCYLLCANTAMSLRRTNLIRWSTYMDECLDALDTSPEALPSDQILVEWVRLQRLADDVGNQISTEDSSSPGVSDVKTQYALKGFERQMRDWEKQASKRGHSPSLTFNFHVANLYMHEFAMHLDQILDLPGLARPADDIQEKSKARSQVLTTAHIGALTTCLTSIHGMFDTVLRMTAEDIRTVPVFYLVRVSYASLLLITMYFAARPADSELGKVISSEDMRVEYYLGKLRDLLQAGGASGKCRLARSFYLVLVMFQTWFERRKEGKGSVSQEAANNKRLEAQPVDVEKHLGQSEYKRMQLNGDAMPPRRSSMAQGAPPVGAEGMDQSRLHVLGEVALGNSSSNGQHTNHGGDGWNAYPAGPVGSTEGGFMGYEYGNTVAPLGMGGYETELAGYQPGLEQAIGMTFNEGNLSYVDDYALYNLMQTPNMFENIA
ncbi:MAG: hypothetical protein Q9219_000641 [cf. Caloplaca sp. 3 TL-2023]